MNKVHLSGRLSADVEVKYDKAGMPFCNFKLAVQGFTKGEDGKYDAYFMPCVAFQKNAEFFGKYGKQGTKFIITGHLKPNNYKEADGHVQYSWEVVVDEREFAESKKADNSAPQAQAQAQPQQVAQPAQQTPVQQVQMQPVQQVAPVQQAPVAAAPVQQPQQMAQPVQQAAPVQQVAPVQQAPVAPAPVQPDIEPDIEDIFY